MTKLTVYQFYAELNDFEPKIWRRFQVPGDISIARLGYITQVLFEMTANHLMAIEVPIGDISREWFNKVFPDKEYHDDGREKIWRFEIPNDDNEPFIDHHRDVKVMDATIIKLSRLTEEPDFTLNLNYDFGDDWWVTLKIEKVFKDNELPRSELPRVLEGENFGIVEDCGGVSNLSDFDITAFDIDDMNFRIKKIPRIYKQIYEDDFCPIRQSVDLIKRKYLKK